MKSTIKPKTRLVLSERLPENGLVKGECLSLTGVVPQNHIAWQAETRYIERAAYLHVALEVIASGHNLESMCANMLERADEIDLEGFSIELINRSGDKVASRKNIIQIANAMPWRPNLSSPTHRLALLVTETDWILAHILGERLRDYEKHTEKPHPSSYSIPTKVARAMVNLVPASAKTMLDPCCGVGTLPIEGNSIGLQVSCGDINENIVELANKNLTHYGMPASARHLDARAWTGRFDAVVTDLPYGAFNHARQEEESVVQTILEHLPKITSLAVVVTQIDLSAELRRVGFEHVDVYQVAKHTSMIRYIHRATKGE